MQPLLLVGAPTNAAPNFAQPTTLQRIPAAASTEQLPVVYSGTGLAFPVINNASHNHFGAWHAHPHCSANNTNTSNSSNNNLMYSTIGAPWLQQSLMTAADLFQANNAAAQQVAFFANTPHPVSVSRCAPHGPMPTTTNHSTLQSLFSTHAAVHHNANLRHQQNLLASTAAVVAANAGYHPATLLATPSSATAAVNSHVWHPSNHPSFHAPRPSPQAMWMASATTTSFAAHQHPPDLLLHFLAILQGHPMTLAASIASAHAFRTALMPPAYYQHAVAAHHHQHQQQQQHSAIFVPQASTSTSQVTSMHSQLYHSAAQHRYIQQHLNAASTNIDSLLHLAAHMSDNKPRGLTKTELESIPTYLICGEADRDPGKEQVTCVVCMCEFEVRQKLRTLHCGHEFHTKCVDRWLKHNRSCPICRADALSGTKQETLD